ncbi:MAG: Transcriptional regulator, XRE family [Candidatus Falkowbacteria bacterium GW2011_GWC2_38_22]|uniref:Transcriptional regulator, XRE family n=1 Tax=Candidatus Falkowbacteria bacterium GW2011_GWE1_38_31 TaxID=1618638 RepID=A0A0G0M9A9_9BACT|nr:MAG: Transcriptional regulator, XRE family [Candidatus Falkowbacteria bacterium GW2011_GWF2_38_1205]KKQ60986.1 MAG: Transcriptional regulator, XRE family [Candidatus Falkowbacteria bacterium GW2011_GWC2_38_22]KKQ63485.1 MAG: Transcriptional regulator, XRE family [Candidatus Falkowbacteria bacterium GW2011_GWF1_38_22]KKQ65444.1 MAG: Transcriptional regulator, XRE family [Candidatus Falkowbacteria bacterium GW2011_GWE2_38_254]KKQ70249.1 MAG: Transcriptional regulator, XRE family [Candidatus Fa
MFTSSKISINSETVGRKLKQARNDKRIELDSAARQLKINIKYLEALENGQLKKLPAGVYAQNYLRTYADFLGLDVAEIISQYKTENEGQIIKKNNRLFVQKVTKARYFLSLPKLLKNFIILALITICVTYIGFYINNLVSAPELEIFSPEKDISTNERKINISGQTEKNSIVNINGKEILISGEGDIDYSLDLKVGLNVIVIQSQKKYSKKSVVIRNILVN